jgi:1,4-dihydroxy-6-naphthoate synthase
MKSEPIRIGFSPCPNDTFIFDALLHGKTDTEGLSFEPVIADVEELNRMAFSGELHLTKISTHALLMLTGSYMVLNSGSALGHGCGPLLIASEDIPEEDIPNKKIAIPGKYTTANLLFSLAFPGATGKTERLFSQIIQDVECGKFDCGLIIHESRFTYAGRGLLCLLDLGAYWESKTGLPIPLGCIAVQRSLPADLRQSLNRIMRRSTEYALANPRSSEQFVKLHAQELEDNVIRAHIELYVNHFTVELGEAGKQAFLAMHAEAAKAGILAGCAVPEFVQ